MLVAFDSLSPNSRLWVYQSSRLLTTGEQSLAASALGDFCRDWSAHGTPLTSSYAIEHALFLILSVDEELSGASGCSIDGSVRVIKDLQEKIGVDFFDRKQVAFIENDVVKIIPASRINDALSAGTVTGSTRTFNTLVATRAEFLSNWMVPMEKTWLNRYLRKNTLV